MVSDPKPRDGVAIEYAQRAIAEGDAYGPDSFLLIDTLEV
jgi:hypothetical protein